ncbi:hypothetical protein RhiirB3_471328 [Rhizophagus irregularis]|nr:hypothetical protein RhiirB3_471328 [Rhizophagus irregularis]
MQECFYYDGFKMDIAIIDSIIQEQTNIDYNERMRENNYEVVKVHLTDVISKIGSDQILEIWRLVKSCGTKTHYIILLVDGSHCCTCICHGFISDKQAILESAFFILKVPKTMLMTFQRLLPIPQSPIANEAVVHEISRQLGNWNVETSQNGIVITSQGGYDFSYEKDDDDENITHQKCKWEDLDSDNILPDFTLDIEFVEKIILQKYEDDELLIEEVKENEDKGEKPMKKI